MKILNVITIGVALIIIGCGSNQNASHNKDIISDTLGIVYTVQPIQFSEIPDILKTEFADTLESHIRNPEYVVGKEIIYIYMSYSDKLELAVYAKGLSYNREYYLGKGYYKIVNGNPLLRRDQFELEFNHQTYSYNGSTVRY